MKKREMSNQLEFIAETIQKISGRCYTQISASGRVEYIKKAHYFKIMNQLYLAINQVKNQLDINLDKRNRNGKISRDINKWEKANRWTCECGTINSPYHDFCTKWECRKPKINS